MLAAQNAKRLFFFALVFSPLAFGTVEPWSYAVMEISIAAALLLCLGFVIQNDLPLAEVPGFFFIAILLGWVLFQLVPLPAFLVRVLSPAAFEIQNNAAFAGQGGAWMVLSVHPSATVAQFFRYGAYAAAYIVAVQLLANRDLLRQAVFLVALFGSLLAFSSILQLYLTENQALWFRDVSDGTVMGPYVNRNHYAGLMGMMFPVVLGLFLFFKPRVGNSTLIQGFKEILSQEKANIHILVGLGALLIVVSIVLSLSRGGITSTCLALLVFTGLLAKRRIGRSSTMITAFVVVLACLSVSWFGWEPIFERFGELKNNPISDITGRLNYYKDSFAAIQDFPVTGAGYGTFKDIYHSYQTITERAYVDHAHNDYLEYLVEGGVVGFVLFGAFLATWFGKTCRAFRSRRDPFAIFVCTGCIVGVSAIVFHSFTDFNLQIGANGLWFSFLLGLSVSAANTRMLLPENATKLRLVKGKWSRSAGLALAAAFFVSTVVFNISNVLGDFYYSHIEEQEVELDTPSSELEKIRSIALRAAMFDPRDAAYAYTVADTSWLLADRGAAESNFLRAIALNPVKSPYYKRYGLFLAQEESFERAERMLALSVRYAPMRSDTALEYGALLTAREKKAEGLKYLKKAVELDPDTIGQVLATMAVAGFSVGEMREAMPDIPKSAIAFGRFLEGIGEPDAAEKSYRHALALMEAGREFGRGEIYRIHAFFKKRGRNQAAMEVLRRAEALLPGDAGIKLRMGDIYREQGIYYKAEEKYEAALLLDPDNRGALRRIEEIKN
jgi:O-antigen ligase/Tfp pilus assembly protein PilF